MDHKIIDGKRLAQGIKDDVKARVTGIILQRPVPRTLDLEGLENTIHHSKDAEGMSSLNIGNIVYGDSALGPCTSLASVDFEA